ncbi:alpha/beta fold hydrolase [Mycobacterium sp. 852002-51057_SCH5723018]|uniref:alpha/beta fold hydrolase n=1 Tax=Mycobacterium sp. 852002-51057_SCH5723018 TaxID=1834094 RepID=UPI000A8D0F11|nr:alpha/beta hydrolase [Mycobacterium sp. 852002-51057_SCH5723018]
MRNGLKLWLRNDGQRHRIRCFQPLKSPSTAAMANKQLSKLPPLMCGSAPCPTIPGSPAADSTLSAAGRSGPKAGEAQLIKAHTTPVVALPGTFCAPRIFARLAAIITDEYQLEALSWMTDAPAWSIDELAEWVASFIEEHFRKVILIGHSTGGAIALRLAGLRPDLIRGLMLINTGPNMNHHDGVLGLVADIEQDRMSAAVHAVLQRCFHIQPSPDDLQALLDYGLAVPPRAALDVLHSQHRTDLLPSLGAVQVPVAVVHGRHDRVRSVFEARVMAASVPDGSLIMASCGHSPMYEVPELVSSALRELDRRTRA